jgi:hypothetical protein
MKPACVGDLTMESIGRKCTDNPVADTSLKDVPEFSTLKISISRKI